MKKWLIVILCALSASLKAQIISTYAGGGTSGLGDGGPALSAKIFDPNGMGFDEHNNLYITENLAHRIRKVDTVGIITTVAGTGIGGYNGDNGLADTSKIWQPEAVVCDKHGNFYFADEHNSRIRKVNVTTGIITTIAGTGVDGYSGDGGLATNATLYSPIDLCFDKWGNLYVSDMTNARIRKIDTFGIITTIAGNGTFGSGGDGGLATSAQLWIPDGLVTDDDGNLYIADFGSKKIRKVSINGIITTVGGDGGYIYGADGILAINTSIDPAKIAINSLGELFIVDNNNNRIRKIDNAGIIHTIAGNGGTGHSGDGGLADSAEIGNPGGIAIDKCDNVYIAEVTNPCIRKVTFYDACFPASVKEISAANDVSIYPNPAHDNIIVTNNNAINDIAIINAMGQTILRQNTGSNKTVLNVAAFQSGVYFIKVSDGKGEVVTRKFIKE